MNTQIATLDDFSPRDASGPKQQSPISVIQQQAENRRPQFQAALPAHIPVERFLRVVLTAVQNNPDLITADRQSLWNSAMRSAQDGLLPDGREGAIVVYNTKIKDGGRDIWIKKAQWMPMVFGILKKVRNSGEIAMVTARVVYGGDKFRYWIDDDGEHVLFEPSDKPDTNTIQRVFAMAKTKGGELYVEPLTSADVEKVRAVSRAKDKGPWVDWWEEMAKKTAIRRLSKRLPMSTDLDDLVRRDDELYNFDRSDEQIANDQRKAIQARSMLDSFSGSVEATAEHDPQTGGIKQESLQGSDSDQRTADDNPEPAVRSDSRSGPEDGSEAAGKRQASEPSESSGPPSHAAAGAKQEASTAVGGADPKAEGEYVAHAMAWIGALTDAADGERRWKQEKALRNHCNVAPEVRDRLQAMLTERLEELKQKDDSAELEKIDRELATAAKSGIAALDAAIAKVPERYRQTLRMAIERRHRPAAAAADPHAEGVQ
jgi:recombination protein RecT